MRKWAPVAWRPGAAAGAASSGVGGSAGALAAVAAVIDHLGTPDFSTRLLEELHPLLSAASCAVYRVGASSKPRLFLSASLGIPDTTRDCWHAYLSGPIHNDRSLRFEDALAQQPAQLCHIAAVEVPQEHRALVYDAHGMAERLSVVERGADGALFAVNFYRHAHQPPLRDGQIANFEQLAPAVLALTRRHVALRVPAGEASSASLEQLRRRLLPHSPDFTPRELDVCARLLSGMSHDGIAADLGLSVATVKTYRNRAFNRLGIHFRSELFARVLGNAA